MEYLDPLGQVRTFHARTVIVASYTFESVRLLLLSADDRHPDGLGGSTGQLGRHFMFKQWGDVYGYLPEVAFNSHTGPAAQMVTLDDFNPPTSTASRTVRGWSQPQRREPAVAAPDRSRSAALRGARLGAVLPAAACVVGSTSRRYASSPTRWRM